jgi:hypothetical protein
MGGANRVGCALAGERFTNEDGAVRRWLAVRWTSGSVVESASGENHGVFPGFLGHSRHRILEVGPQSAVFRIEEDSYHGWTSVRFDDPYVICDEGLEVAGLVSAASMEQVLRDPCPMLLLAERLEHVFADCWAGGLALPDQLEQATEVAGAGKPKGSATIEVVRGSCALEFCWGHRRVAGCVELSRRQFRERGIHA